MAIIIELKKEEIDKVDMAGLTHFIEWSSDFKYFGQSAGKELYKLLLYISLQINCKTFVDIGTGYGFSALALSIDDRKNVITYDIVNKIPNDQMTILNKANISFKCMDYTEDLDQDKLQNTDLIVLDIDHNGYYEQECIIFLEKNKYKGLVLIDSINLNPQMRNFWDNIKQTKIDVSSVGHWTGTGMVVFDTSKYTIKL